MLETILFVGFGAIIALGGIIMLDRERFDRHPRVTYRLATVSGLAIGALAIVGIL